MRPTTYWTSAILTSLVAAVALVALKRPSTSFAPQLAPIAERSGLIPLASAPGVAETAGSSAIAHFAAWAGRFQTESGARRLAEESLGVQLAIERRAEMQQLIRTNPRRALESALSSAQREGLPATVRSYLEEQLSGSGDYLVIGTLAPSASLSPAAQGFSRRVIIGQRSFEAFVYGRRTTEKSHTHIPLHGIVLDGAMAVAESPLRVLEPGELPDPAKTKLPEVCEISGNPASPGPSGPVVVEVGNEIHYLCTAGHVSLLEKKLVAQEGDFFDLTQPTGNSVAREPLVNSPYTTGQKGVLFIRVRFANQPANAEPESVLDSSATLAGANAFITENSYGKTSLVGTVTPVYVLPHDEAWYSAPENDLSGFFFRVLSDARDVAANPSAFPGNDGQTAYDFTAYDFEVVRYNGGPGAFSGQAFIGSRGIWLKTDSAGALAHELGHNFGLNHANRWSPATEDLFGPGSNLEYGDGFDTMGAALGGRDSFNAGYRSLLGWLPGENVQTVVASGTYRLYAFDQMDLSAGQHYLLKVHKDAERDYWGEFRQQWPDNRWTENGLQLRWSPWSQSNGGSQLIDTQPGNSTDGASDSAVVIGRTFSDRAAGTHFTPIGKGGTSPESLDVVLNLGNFPDNHAPAATLSVSSTHVAVDEPVSFSLNATDPDGDRLAYDWEFNNGTVGPNAPTASASWSSVGEYRVLVTVSDMKGKHYLASSLIQVGAPSTLAISGRVTDDFGQPAVGVRVHNGLSGVAYRSALTDSEGNYTLTNLNPGVYPIIAVSADYTAILPTGFANPVAAGATAINFTATLPPPAVSVVATHSDTSESASAPGVFTVSRQTEAPLSNVLVITFQLSGTAAYDGSDYSLSSSAPFTFDPGTGTGQLTIPAGASSAGVQLQAIDDSAVEGTELATLTLLSSGAYALLSAAKSATITIADNDAPDNFTEFFTTPTKPFDLNGRQLTFTPTSVASYRGNVDAASRFPTVVGGGTILSENGTVRVPLAGGNPDDGYWKIDLPEAPTLFFGKTYGQLFINTNGSITFNAGDPISSGSVVTHFAAGRPRIAAYWRDLTLNAGGTVSYRVLTTPGLERTVVTFERVPFYGDPTQHANVQIELWASGVITLTWLDSSAADATVGLSAGLGSNFAFYESDLSRYPPLPPSFNSWRAARFTPTELENPAISGVTVDYDHDGLSNLLEYALGRDPKQSETSPAITSSVIEVDRQRYLTLTFARSLTATDVSLEPKFGSTLKEWPDSAVQVGTSLILDGDREQVTYRDIIPIGSSSARFGRIEVTKP